MGKASEGRLWEEKEPVTVRWGWNDGALTRPHRGPVAAVKNHTNSKRENP